MRFFNQLFPNRLAALLALFALCALGAQSDAAPRLVINEIMINEPGPETALEWIELINTAPEAVDLAGFCVVDGKDTTRFATRSIESEGFVVLSRKPVTSDSSASFESRWGNGSGIWGDIPEERFSVVAAKFSLRNSCDTLRLVEIGSGQMEVVSWRSSPPDGVSLERINWAISARSGNFGYCKDSTGSTPGRVNSVVAPQLNLGLIGDSLEIEFPDDPIAPVELRFAVANSGLKVAGGTVSIRLDDDQNGEWDEFDWRKEITIAPLLPDSFLSISEVLSIPFGRNLLIIELCQDADSSDNRAECSFYCNSGFAEFRISEFMPVASDSGCGEWIELENVAGYPVPLQNWVLFSGAKSDTIRAGANIAPGARAILCADTAHFRERSATADCAIGELIDWPQLADGSGAIRLVNDFGIDGDSVIYAAEFESGQSWERDADSIGTPFLNGFYPSSAAAGATPCQPNSERVLPPAFDLALSGNKIQLEIDSLNPLLVQFDFLVQNRGRLMSLPSNLTIFDDRNRNQQLDPQELLQTSSIPPLDAQDSIRIQPALELSQGRHWLRAQLDEDEVVSNNRAMAVVTLGALTGEVIITEFLVDPAGELESEWVEIRSSVDYPIMMSRWCLGDEVGLAPIAVDHALMPGEYLVFAQDSLSFTGFYGEGCTPSTLRSWSNFNNGGDIISVWDEFGHLVDSIRYAGGVGGNRSLELNELEDRPGVPRWFASTDAMRATPCRTNSASSLLPDFDLGFATRSLDVDREAVESFRVTVAAVVKNLGRLPSPPSKMTIYADADRDGYFAPQEKISEREIETIAAYDSASIAIEFDLVAGRHSLLALLSPDDRADNDSAFGAITTGSPTRELIITEFLPGPEGYLETEWTEIFNPRQIAIDLTGWRFGDSTGQSLLGPAVEITPGAYVIVAQDTSACRKFYDIDCPLLTTAGWKSLNNDGDGLVLRDEFGSLVDSVSFARPAPDNRSIELNQAGDGRWYCATAEAGATPCRQNSVSGPVTEVVSVRLLRRVFAPAQDEQLAIEITCPPATPLTIEIFDLAGRRHRLLAQAQPFSSGQLHYDGASDYFSRLPVGAYILKVAAEDGSGFETKAGFAVAVGR